MSLWKTFAGEDGKLSKAELFSGVATLAGVAMLVALVLHTYNVYHMPMTMGEWQGGVLFLTGFILGNKLLGSVDKKINGNGEAKK